MLLAQISPKISKVVQTGGRTVLKTIEYYKVSVGSYTIGYPIVTFTVDFGNVIKSGNTNVFESDYKQTVQVMSSNLSTWGTDDTVLFQILANILNISVSNFLDIKDVVVPVIAPVLPTEYFQGLQGVQGFQGFQGLQGVQGFQGFQGN
jgi:hypothetical protein